MAKITLPTIAAGYASNTAFNTAYDLIEAEFQNKVLYRNNTSGEANTMANALDMNSNNIINAATITCTAITVAGVSLTTKVAEAAASATAAASSATAAASSATAAASSASAAAGYVDTFDDKYLGSKSSAPTVDNDGDALTDGALYFNTTSNIMFVYDLGSTTWLQLTLTSSNQTNVNTVAANITNVNTVAGISANVTTVAGISSNVTSVAGNATNINTVAGISANVTTVAGIASNVTAVAGNATNINAVAADSADIGAVAGKATEIGRLGTTDAVADMALLGTSANVTNMATLGASGVVTNIATVATNVAGVNSFADLYRGAQSSAPTGTITTGTLYYNTSDSKLYIYTGSSWDEAAFSLTGSVTSFNTRSGAVTLSSGDVTTALTFTPQAVNANLTAIAGLTSAADKGIQFTGSGSAAVYDLTAAGKALLDDADASAQRTTLGLGTAAVLATGISNTNVPKFTTGVADDDFLKVAGTDIEGRSAAEVLSDIGGITASSSDTLTNKSIAASQLTGTIATARLGSGTASSSTFLAGDQTYKTISSNPEKLVKDFTLTSGKTVTAGKMVSIASNGEVGTLPTLNTTGTYRAKSGTENDVYGSFQPGGSLMDPNGKGGISHNGSRGLSVGTYSGSTTSRVVTLQGHAFSSSATRVDGSTTVTVPIQNYNDASKDAYTGIYISNGGAWYVYVQPLSDTKFMVISQGAGKHTTSNWTYTWNGTVVTVDANGDLTKGSTTTNTFTTTDPNAPSWVQVGYYRRAANDTVITGHDSAESGWNFTQEATYGLKRFCVWDGSNTINIYKSNIATHAFGAMTEDPYNSIRTSGNKIVWLNYEGARSVSVTNADGGFPANSGITFQTRAAISATTTGTGVAIVGDQYTGGLVNDYNNDTLAYYGYNHTGDNNRVYIPFSVNASTGALTNDNGTFNSGSTDANDGRIPKQKTFFANTAQTEGVSIVTDTGTTYVNSFDMNSKGVPTATNLRLALTGGTAYNLTQVRNLTGSTWLLFLRSGTDNTTTMVTVDYTVNAASTGTINFLGFPTATDSSTPTSIIIKGVAAGFTSLTIGSLYYQSNANDGSVTTASDEGVLVGKAISATEILIDREI